MIMYNGTCYKKICLEVNTGVLSQIENMSTIQAFGEGMDAV